MPRPSITERVAVDADGSLLTWVDGELAGDKYLLAGVRRAAAIGLPVPFTVTGPVIVANLNNPIGATAAMLAAVPGRTRILEAPDAVLDLFIMPDGTVA